MKPNPGRIISSGLLVLLSYALFGVSAGLLVALLIGVLLALRKGRDEKDPWWYKACFTVLWIILIIGLTTGLIVWLLLRSK